MKRLQKQPTFRDDDELVDLEAMVILTQQQAARRTGAAERLGRALEMRVDGDRLVPFVKRTIEEIRAVTAYNEALRKVREALIERLQAQTD